MKGDHKNTGIKKSGRILFLTSLISFLTLTSIPLYANLFQESVKYYKAGDYKKAMMGFMDVVLNEPSNAAAGDYLRRAGIELLKKDEDLARRQGGKFLEEASAVKDKMDDFRKAKAKRLKAWRSLLDVAKKFASDHDTIREAVLAYEDFLEKTPVYSDGYPEFQNALSELKKTFYKTIKSRYPYLIDGKDTVDERDLVALFFARESINDFSYRYIYSNRTQAILDKATKIKMLEEKIGRVYSSARRAYEIYSFGKYRDSIDLWKEVLKFDHTNEEAHMCLDFARGHLAGDILLAEAPEGEKTAEAEAAPEDKGIVVADINIISPSSPPLKKRETGGFGKPVTTRKKTVPRSITEAGRQSASPLPARRSGPPSYAAAEGGGAMEEVGGGGAPEEAEKAYEKGILEFSLGNMENAAEYWKECLELNPKHLKARVGLERIRK